MLEVSVKIGINARLKFMREKVFSLGRSVPLKIAVFLAAAILASACATGPGVQRSLPAPPRAAERVGPWDLTIALYDPALFGPERPLAELIKEYRLPLDNGRLKNPRFLVNKSQRRLELWVRRRMVKAYRVQLGWNPHGPKIRQGDRKTPEGEYFVCARLPSTYHMSLWISYPNLEDARRGLESGLITGKEYEAIAAALKNGACPPQDTKLGGNLLLHGQQPEYTTELARAQHAQPGLLRPGLREGDADPAMVREFEDWTDGCVALFNPDIRELYEFVPDGSPITIVAEGKVTLPPKSRR